MFSYNFTLLKDELSLTAWLVIGAAGQLLVTFLAPAKYALVPVGLTFAILAIDFITQLLGLQKSVYLKDAVMGRHAVLFPNEDGSRPDKMASQSVAIFMIGIRSNHPLGRLLPDYQTMNRYYDEIYKDAEDNRATNGYLGRTPNWVNNEFSQNNTLVSISYWKSIEDLEAFGRRPVHVKSMMFLNAAFRGPKGHTLGVMHEVMVCPAGHWEPIYGNLNPWGFGATKFPIGKNLGFRPPYYETDPKVLNGMRGRMGDLIKQAQADEKLGKVVETLTKN
jgi:hypothetical protein